MPTPRPETLRREIAKLVEDWLTKRAHACDYWQPNEGRPLVDSLTTFIQQREQQARREMRERLLRFAYHRAACAIYPNLPWRDGDARDCNCGLATLPDEEP